MIVVLSPTLVSDDYAPQTAGHVSLPGPTAPLVTELLQLPVPGYGTVYRHSSGMLTYRIQSVPAVIKDIFVWIVGPRRSVNYLTAPSRNNLTYLLTYLYKRHQTRAIADQLTIVGQPWRCQGAQSFEHYFQLAYPAT